MRCVLVGTASSAILYTNAHLLNSKLDHIVDNFKPSASDPAKTCDGGIPRTSSDRSYMGGDVR